MVELQSKAVAQVGRKKMRCQSQTSGKKTEEEEEAEVEQGKPKEAEVSRSKRQPWSTLQRSFRNVLEKMKKEEMKVSSLSHGLQHLCRVVFAGPVRGVAYSPLKRLFVVLEAGQTQLHLLREDGSYASRVAVPAPLAGLVYATQVDQFVGWDEEGLQVLDSGFQLLSQVPSPFPIRCGLYAEPLNQIVTAGEGNLMIWGFRYGFRSLQCQVAVTQGLEATNLFSRLTLGVSATENPRCFASCGTGAAAFDIDKGRLLSFRKDLHSRLITDIAYCQVTGCAVTASRDTTIKVWDENWNIQTVFVGHTAPVIAVTIYPDRPLIFSASLDGTLRTWNLDTIDQVDQVNVSEPVETLETKTASHVLSTSGSALNLWKINKLYSLYIPMGSPIKHLSCSNLEALGNFPLRLLCVCRDSTVRLVDAQNGLLLSTFSVEHPDRVEAAAYCLPRETLFVLTEQGTLLRVNTAANPMVLRKSTPNHFQGSRPRCLLIYSHIVDSEAAYATWCDVMENKSYRKQWQKPPLQMQEKNRYLPILGHGNGFLSVVEWFSGRTLYEVEAHGSGCVTALAEYPTQTCVISAGMDLTVKMWRLFPYTEECLVPLLCFTCASPAVHLCSMGETLAVASQDPETVTYHLVFYNLMEQTRFEHLPEDEAQDDITGLASCPNLKLFASASRDGSVKVWDIKNKLLRHLKLNTIPESLAFANRWGDLLVGIERHLYLIHHNKYLPNHYRMKFLCEKFLEPIKDVPFPLSNACFQALVKENVRRLLHEPPLEEAESPLPGVQHPKSQAPKGRPARSQDLSELAQRNHDLELLCSGKVSPAKRPKATKATQEEAFERYLRIFYKEQPKLEIPRKDPFDADEVLEAMHQVDSVSQLYGPPCNPFLGSFSRPSILKTAEQTPLESRSGHGLPMPRVSSGYIPNSVVAHQFHVLAQPELQEEETLEERLIGMTGSQEVPESPSRVSSAWTFGSLEPEESSPKELSGAKLAGSPKSPVKQSPPTVFLTQLDESQYPEKDDVLPPSFILPFVDKEWFKTIFPEGLPPKMTLQEFLAQLLGNMALVDFNMKTELVNAVVTLKETLKDQMRETVYKTLLHVLNTKEGPSMQDRSQRRFILACLRALTNMDKDSKELMVELVTYYVISPPKARMAVKDLMQEVGIQDPHNHLYKELESWPVEEQDTKADVRKMSKEWLEGMMTELEEFRTHLLGAKLLLEDEKENYEPGISQTWPTGLQGEPAESPLQEQRSSPGEEEEEEEEEEEDLTGQPERGHFFSMSMEEEEQEEAAMGHEAKSQVVLPSWEQQESAEKLEPSDDGSPEKQLGMKVSSKRDLEEPSGDNVVLGELPERKPSLKRPQKPRPGQQEASWGSVHGMAFLQKTESAQHWLRVVRPIDAIHYFTEKQLERELESMKRLVSAAMDTPRDTFMVLPPLRTKRAILRLGETNTMWRKRIPKSFYFPKIFPRYLLKGFVPFMKLPLPKIRLDPFLPPDRPPSPPKTFTALQQSVRKYFIPKYSYADSYL